MATSEPLIDRIAGNTYTYEQAREIDQILQKELTNVFRSYVWRYVGQPNSFIYFNSGG